jgi:hypothetical protein
MTAIWILNEWKTGYAQDLLAASDPNVGLSTSDPKAPSVAAIRSVLRAWIPDPPMEGVALTKALKAKIAQLGLTVPVDYRNSIDLASGPTRGDVVVIFADNPTKLPVGAPQWFRTCVVLPVVKDATDVSALPAYLQERNAFIMSMFQDYTVEVLVDDVLSHAVLSRTTKSVFVSYKRSDSLNMARQIAERLGRDGFSVFLDERSIGRSERFADEIAYRLDDVDAVILLATPDLQNSKWVQKEIAFAKNASIALVAVDCGNSAGTHPVLRGAMADQRFRPNRVPQGENDTLDERDLEDLIGMVYRHRVAGIVRRVQDLLPPARAAFATMSKSTVSQGNVLGELKNELDEVLRVLPHRPTAEHLWQIRRGCGAQDKIRVVYPESVPRDRRVRALRWAFLGHRPLLEILHVRHLFR